MGLGLGHLVVLSQNEVGCKSPCGFRGVHGHLRADSHISAFPKEPPQCLELQPSPQHHSKTSQDSLLNIDNKDTQIHIRQSQALFFLHMRQRFSNSTPTERVYTCICFPSLEKQKVFIWLLFQKSLCCDIFQQNVSIRVLLFFLYFFFQVRWI